jgi:hypothetical protein
VEVSATAFEPSIATYAKDIPNGTPFNARVQLTPLSDEYHIPLLALAIAFDPFISIDTKDTVNGIPFNTRVQLTPLSDECHIPLLLQATALDPSIATNVNISLLPVTGVKELKL